MNEEQVKCDYQAIYLVPVLLGTREEEKYLRGREGYFFPPSAFKIFSMGPTIFFFHSLGGPFLYSFCSTGEAVVCGGLL